MALAVRPVFSSSAAGPTARLERLRRALCAAETATGLAGDGGVLLTLGIPLIDNVLGGGFCGSALHEIAATRETEIAVATGFALALAARSNMASNGSVPNSLASKRDAIWIAEDLSLAENGAPYGPGLHEAGIVPERLITVAAARGRDVLWAMEEALRCRAVGVVIGELRARNIDHVASRRLSLAAASGNTLGLILRTAPDDTPSAAATRWIIGAAPSAPARLLPHPQSASAKTLTPVFDGLWTRATALMLRDGWGEGSVGPPRLNARLVRNRRGHLGAWIVEWNSVEQRFELATHPESVAGAASDRPLRWRAK